MPIHSTENAGSATGPVWEGQVTQEERLGFYNKACAGLLRPHVGRRILDIGVGLGNVAAFLMDDVESYIGVDVVCEHIRRSRMRFRDEPFEGLVMDVTKESELDALVGLDWDSMISVNCFEHIEDDLAVFQNLGARAKPGTRFAFLVPAHQALYGALDAQGGHYRRYTKVDLGEKLVRAGFRVEGMRYFNLVGALAWLVMGRLFTGSSGGQTSSPEKVTWRWRLLYGLSRLARYPLQVILALEERIEFGAGLSLIAWGSKE